MTTRTSTVVHFVILAAAALLGLGSLALPPTHAAYQAVCDICGNVGRLQPYLVDADAIAVWHFEQGGFERRGA